MAITDYMAAVNYNLKTGDFITCQTPGGEVTTKVVDTFPDRVIVEYTGRNRGEFTYDELQDECGARFATPDEMDEFEAQQTK